MPLKKPTPNEKHQRFVVEYLKDVNATQAAIRAGYSPKTAKQQGARLLTNADVQAAVSAGQAKHLERAEITAEHVLEELACVAFLDPRGFFDADGNLKKVSELDVRTAAALSEFVILKENLIAGDGKNDTVYRVKWSDKVRALELLMKRFGLLKERVDVTGLNELVERLAKARTRVAQKAKA